MSLPARRLGFHDFRTALLVIATTGGLTGLLTLQGALRGSESAMELVELPLMSLMLVAVALNLERRRRADRARRAASEELERALERERWFFASASHELKTPLTIARGHLELLGRDGPPRPSQVADVRSLVLEELARMQDLVGDLLFLARLEATSSFEREQVDVEDLLDRANARWAPLHPDRFRVEVGATGVIAVDLPALERAVANLVENALAHTRRGESVALRTTSDGWALRITVEDTGDGIPPTALPHVCEQFFRAGPRSRTTGSAGLGLSIVKAVVDAHGGELEIASRPGEGTRVTITLPGLRPGGRRYPTSTRLAA